MSYGHSSVAVFIVISGFCLMLPISRNGGSITSLGAFFRRRARRILPPYYAALLPSVVLILTIAGTDTGTVWDTSLPLTWQQLQAHALLIHDLPFGWEGGTINYPLWSVAVEWQLYLLMPFIALSFRRFGSVPSLVLGISVGLALHVFSGGWLDSATPWFLGLFAMGCAAAVHVQTTKLKQVATFRLLPVALWGTVVLLILILRTSIFYVYIAYIDTLIGVATATTLILMYREAADGNYSVLTRLASWRPLVRIGAFSYSLYLIHAPLVHLVDRAFVATINPRPEVIFVLLVLASPTVVAGAYLFYLAFERPFLSVSHSRSLIG